MKKNDSICIKRKWKKGSFTIETACVMFLVLFVIMGILYLCFFIHNRAWLTAAAFESALAGSMEGERVDGKVEETAANRSAELGNINFFGIENLRVQVQTGKSVQVVYTADTISGFGGFLWKLKAVGKSKMLDPVTWVRNIKAAGDIIVDIGGE